MPFEKVADYLRGCPYKVLRVTGAREQYEDEYVVSHSWTEKSVRHVYARERLYAEIMFDAEGNER